MPSYVYRRLVFPNWAGFDMMNVLPLLGLFRINLRIQLILEKWYPRPVFDNPPSKGVKPSRFPKMSFHSKRILENEENSMLGNDNAKIFHNNFLFFVLVQFSLMVWPLTLTLSTRPNFPLIAWMRESEKKSAWLRYWVPPGGASLMQRMIYPLKERTVIFIPRNKLNLNPISPPVKQSSIS